MKKKVIVGLSGGVDSSIAAWLLLQQGYEVEALFMKNWEEDDTEEYCSSAKDLADAQSVSDKLGIRLHTVNFSKTYWQKVFSYFLDEYEAGRTPNPDILCNKEIKFKAFLEHALNLGADYIATGHYARRASDSSILLKAKDRAKDQTYFLHAVAPEALKKTLFPIGDYSKDEVRHFAKELNLVTHDKKDSTGICFIGERRFKTFLKEFVLARPGEIHDLFDNRIGSHEGLMFHTFGQRQGLGIGGIQNSFPEPWYVVDKDLSKNILYVAQGAHHPMLYAQGLICSPIHWLTEKEPEFPYTCHCKIRYRQNEEPCVISPLQNQQHYVLFSNLQRAVTPGQFIVFYDKNQCLGGATIEEIIR